MVEFVRKSVFVAFLAVYLSSCGSPNSQSSTNSQEESSLYFDYVYPSENTELKMDTSFSSKGNTYQVFSNHFTIPEQFVSVIAEYEDGDHETLGFRDWAVEIIIKKNGRYQVRDTFNKYDFHGNLESFPEDSIFLRNSTIHSFRLTDVQDRPIFEVVIGIPDTDDDFSKRIFFDDSGKLMVSTVEEGDWD